MYNVLFLHHSVAIKLYLLRSTSIYSLHRGLNIKWSGTNQEPHRDKSLQATFCQTLFMYKICAACLITLIFVLMAISLIQDKSLNFFLNMNKLSQELPDSSNFNCLDCPRYWNFPPKDVKCKVIKS